MRLNIWITALFFSICSHHIYSDPSLDKELETLPTPQIREDITKSLTPKICSTQNNFSMKDLWNANIFDTSLEIQFIELNGENSISETVFQRAGKILAKKNNHNGFSFGSCPNKLGYVVTTPAPQSFILNKKEEQLHISTEGMQKYCKEIMLDYVASKGGIPRNLQRIKPQTDPESDSNLVINLNFLDAGVISVTCDPSYRSNLGPELWYLVPIKSAHKIPLPHAKILQKSSAEKSIFAWINAIRLDMKLNPVTSEQEKLENIQKTQTQNTTIHHDELALERIKDLIQKNNGRFIGENRVKGQNPLEMAWLLWNSPRHRELLLSRKASAILLNIVELKQEKLAIITFARF